MAFSATDIIEKEKKEKAFTRKNKFSICSSTKEAYRKLYTYILLLLLLLFRPKGEKYELSFRTSSDTEKRNEPRVP